MMGNFQHYWLSTLSLNQLAIIFADAKADTHQATIMANTA
jgi:hypothetical protein